MRIIHLHRRKTGWYNIKNITDYSDVYIELCTKNGIRVDYSSNGLVSAYLLAGETYYCRIK